MSPSTSRPGDAAAPAAATPPVRSPVLSLGTAIVLGAGVLLAGTSGPLVACGAAVFLTFVVENDVRTLRIPNLITLPALFGAVAVLRRVVSSG